MHKASNGGGWGSGAGSGRCFPSIFVLLLFVGLALYYGGAVWSLAGAGMGSVGVSPFFVKIMRSDVNDEDLAQRSKAEFNFLAVIDAGSSGCRAYVYRYGKLDNPMGPLYVVPRPDGSKKVKPGLSSFAKKPTEAGLSLQVRGSGVPGEAMLGSASPHHPDTSPVVLCMVYVRCLSGLGGLHQGAGAGAGVGQHAGVAQGHCGPAPAAGRGARRNHDVGAGVPRLDPLHLPPRLRTGHLRIRGASHAPAPTPMAEPHLRVRCRVTLKPCSSLRRGRRARWGGFPSIT